MKMEGVLMKPLFWDKPIRRLGRLEVMWAWPRLTWGVSCRGKGCWRCHWWLDVGPISFAWLRKGVA